MRGGLRDDGDGPDRGFLAVVVLVAAIVVAGSLLSVRASRPGTGPATPVAPAAQ